MWLIEKIGRQMNVNLECVKSINQIGQTIYQNICDGSVTAVPWGNLDYLGMIAISLFFIGVFVFIAIFLLALLTNL